MVLQEIAYIPPFCMRNPKAFLTPRNRLQYPAFCSDAFFNPFHTAENSINANTAAEKSERVFLKFIPGCKLRIAFHESGFEFRDMVGLHSGLKGDLFKSVVKRCNTPLLDTTQKKATFINKKPLSPFMAQQVRWDQHPPRWEDKEVTIKLRPWKLIQMGMVLVLLFGVFFLGRWSVDANLPSFTDASAKITKKVDAISGATVVAPTNKTTPAPATTAPVPANDTTATVAANDTANDTAAEPAVATFITAYSGGKIALSLNDVRKEWKGTWGKITHLDITVKNNEAGTIQPSYVTMIIEGYEDVEKRVPLPLSARELGAGKTYTQVIPVPAGFAYSEVTAGDLSSVKITLALFDVNDKQMTTFYKDFNLKG